MTRIHKAAIIAVVGLIGLFAAPAAAQVYPPSGDTLTIGDTTLSPGQSTTLSGRCSDSGATTITATLFNSHPVQLGTTTADAGGAWSMVITIPTDATPGAHTITAEGAGCSASVTVTIVGGAAAPAQPAAGTIAFTGSSSVPLAGMGIGLVIVGGAVAFAARRRMRTRISA